MSGFFIVRVNPVGWLTLLGLAIDLAAFFLLLDTPSVTPGMSFSPGKGPETLLFLAVGLMHLGMLADAFDGILARRLKMESEFGRYLDGFVDVFNYLVLPNMALWRLGFSGPVGAALLSVMVACGVLRLSKFNMIGNIKENGESKYLGMPVFWSQLLFFPLYLVFALAPPQAFPVCVGVVWAAMSLAFIWNRPFFKPKNTWMIAGLTLGLAGGGIAGFFLGLHP